MPISLKDIERGIKFLNNIAKQGESFIENGQRFLAKVSEFQQIQNNPQAAMAAAYGRHKLHTYQEKVKRINSISTETLKKAKRSLDGIIADREKYKDVIDAEYTEIKK